MTHTDCYPITVAIEWQLPGLSQFYSHLASRREVLTTVFLLIVVGLLDSAFRSLPVERLGLVNMGSRLGAGASCQSCQEAFGRMEDWRAPFTISCGHVFCVGYELSHFYNKGCFA